MTSILSKLRLCLLAALVCLPAMAQRSRISINDCWSFILNPSGDAGDCAQAQTVSFPHTWNAVDCDDDTPGYFRGLGVYTRKVKVEPFAPESRVTVLFEGANQVTTLLVNGKLVGSHTGGYTAFSFDVTDYVQAGLNDFEIRVDNSHNPDIPPLSADFTFFGGVTRDVYLIYSPKAGISTTHYASDGVYVRTAKVEGNKAEVEISAMLSNTGEEQRKMTLQASILDRDGRQVAVASRKVKLPAHCSNAPQTLKATVPDVRLWSLDDPYMYRVKVSLSDAQSSDEVSVPLGVRTSRFDSEEGFFLNGEYVRLMGTNRHQDYLGKGYALSDEFHESDVRLLKEMGGNFLRVSHYPQDPVVMYECDKSGIVTSVEIPIVNAVTMSPAFKQNCLEMAREMMYQNWNHPSVLMWAYMNEVCLKIPQEYSEGQARKDYFAFMADVASSIESVFRTGDPDRYTMLPCHSNPEVYLEAGIGHIPMIIGFNIYDGWYRETFAYLATRLDHIHELYPDQPLLITEYGADVDPRVHSFNPERFDFSCEWGNLYHEAYIPIILSRKFVAGTTIWNLNDFYSENRGQAVPHVNNKGITGLDRTKKDPYYLYQAYLLESPVMHIVTSGWKLRCGVPVQDFKVYTNAGRVSACLNGESLGEFEVEAHIAHLPALKLRKGHNQLQVSGVVGGEQCFDVYDFDYRDYSIIEEDFNSLNVILGGRRVFEDNKARCVWVNEQEYTPGSWGYVGGRPYTTLSSRGVVPASTDNILMTDNNPVFQTVRSGIEEFRADVPAGEYSVYLYFCELSTVEPSEGLAYNFGNDQARPYSESVFDVEVNGRTVIKDCDIYSDVGAFRPVVRKISVSVAEGEGLSVRFSASKGEPFLNAIRIWREF